MIIKKVFSPNIFISNEKLTINMVKVLLKNINMVKVINIVKFSNLFT